MNLNNMNPIHKEIADKYIETGNGTQSVKEVCPELSDEAAAVKASRVIRYDKVKAYLEDKAEMAAIRIQELSEQKENLTVALGASKDIMDRAGFKPVDKQEIAVKELPAPILGYVQTNNSINKNSSSN